MLPVENLFANFAEKLSGRPFFGPAEERMSYQEMEATLTRVDEYIKVILPDADKTPTLDELLAAAQVCVVRYGVKMFVLDPYNEIEHTRTQWMTETEYISYFMARLRKFARQNGVLVFLVAHPTSSRRTSGRKSIRSRRSTTSRDRRISRTRQTTAFRSGATRPPRATSCRFTS